MLKSFLLQPKISIGIVLFGTQFLHESLSSLITQDYPAEKIEFLFRDHSPNAEAKKIIEQKLPAVAKKSKTIAGKNLFHSSGHNFLINKSSGDYYICASQDMLYSPDFVSKSITELEKPENQKVGSVAVKLLQWSNDVQIPLNKGGCEAPDLNSKQNHQSRGIIDSLGLGITHGHKFYDFKQGKIDSNQFGEKKEIFGPSGALAIYRRSALEDIKFGEEYFDKLLHYKNDVDLAYRLQWSGWKCLLLPEATCWHARGLGSEKGRRKRSQLELESSFFGQHAVIQKNFSSDFSLRTKLTTKLRNFFSTIYTAVCEPRILKQLRRLKKVQAELGRKSKAIKRRASVSEIEKYMI